MSKLDDIEKNTKISEISAHNHEGANPLRLAVITYHPFTGDIKHKFRRDSPSESFIWVESMKNDKKIKQEDFIVLSYTIDELKNRGFNIGKSTVITILQGANTSGT